jgi:hypothetical protein
LRLPLLVGEDGEDGEDGEGDGRAGVSVSGSDEYVDATAAAAVTRRCMPRTSGDTADASRRRPVAMGDDVSGGLGTVVSMVSFMGILNTTQKVHGM